MFGNFFCGSGIFQWNPNFAGHFWSNTKKNSWNILKKENCTFCAWKDFLGNSSDGNICFSDGKFFLSTNHWKIVINQCWLHWEVDWSQTTGPGTEHDRAAAAKQGWQAWHEQNTMGSSTGKQPVNQAARTVGGWKGLTKTTLSFLGGWQGDMTPPLYLAPVYCYFYFNLDVFFSDASYGILMKQSHI